MRWLNTWFHNSNLNSIGQRRDRLRRRGWSRRSSREILTREWRWRNCRCTSDSHGLTRRRYRGRWNALSRIIWTIDWLTPLASIILLVNVRNKNNERQMIVSQSDELKIGQHLLLFLMETRVLLHSEDLCEFTFLDIGNQFERFADFKDDDA